MKGIGWLVVASSAMLVGCASVDDIRTVQPQGTDFTKALAMEYRDLALFEADEMADWRDADYFAAKGLNAAQGNVVAPSKVTERELPEAAIAELSDARAKFMSFMDQGVADRLPAAAARAQVKYDCWMEQQEEDFQNDHISACRDDFFAALSGLAPAPAPVVAAKPTPVPTPKPVSGTCELRSYLVFFDFDSSNISDEAEAVIEQAVEDLQAPDCQNATVRVVGHTDTMGSSSYNAALSLRRADNVVRMIRAAGVSPASISSSAEGESSLRVATGDEVRESENRRVAIEMQN